MIMNDSNLHNWKTEEIKDYVKGEKNKWDIMCRCTYIGRYVMQTYFTKLFIEGIRPKEYVHTKWKTRCP